MNTIVFLSVYLAFGYLFMTTCAKFGWISKYDPAIFYWICWPMIILIACFKVVASFVDRLNTALENYVNTLKPNQDEL